MFDSSLFSKSNSGLGESSLLGASRGFTLIELILVTGLASILMVGLIALINPSLQLKKARDAERKSDLKQMQVALEIYRSDQGSYPSNSGVLGNCPASSPTSLTELDTEGNCPAEPTKVFLQIIPKDPKTGTNYYYEPVTASNGVSIGYTIYSCLENSTDLDKLSSSTTPQAPTSPTILNALSCPAEVTTYYGLMNQ